MRKIYTKDYYKKGNKYVSYLYELDWYCPKCNYTLIDRFAPKLGYQHLINPYSLNSSDKSCEEILRKILNKIKI